MDGFFTAVVLVVTLAVGSWIGRFAFNWIATSRIATRTKSPHSYRNQAVEMGPGPNARAINPTQKDRNLSDITNRPESS